MIATFTTYLLVIGVAVVLDLALTVALVVLALSGRKDINKGGLR